MTRGARKYAGANRRRARRPATRSRNRCPRHRHPPPPRAARPQATAAFRPASDLQNLLDIPVQEDPIIVKAKEAAAVYAGSLPNFSAAS